MASSAEKPPSAETPLNSSSAAVRVVVDVDFHGAVWIFVVFYDRVEVTN